MGQLFVDVWGRAQEGHYRIIDGAEIKADG